MIKDMYINTDLPLLFFIDIILNIKAIISTGTATPTVKSHQCPPSNVTIPNNINAKNVIIASKKNIVNPTDHLPSRQSGNIFISWPPLKLRNLN
jgi:hypothetical protein